MFLRSFYKCVFLPQYIVCVCVFSAGEDLLADTDSQSITGPTTEDKEQDDVTVRNQCRSKLIQVQLGLMIRPKHNESYSEICLLLVMF